MSAPPETIVILDFGSQYTQLIARRIRAHRVHSVILPCSTAISKIKNYRPAGIILSGGPSSVYEKSAPSLRPKILDIDLPLLGICYGMQTLVQHRGGKVMPARRQEYGQTSIRIRKKSPLFKSIRSKHLAVWMSHGDRIEILPRGWEVIAESESAMAAIADTKKRHYGLQFHPEVVHSEGGDKILKNFLFEICRAHARWTMPSFIDATVTSLRRHIADKKVVLGLSGGVDSSTLAILLHRALGDKLTCVFVDNGLIRRGEADDMKTFLIERYGINVRFVRAGQTFLSALRDVVDPEKKRTIIGKIFVDVFFKAIADFDFLAQGTLYPDVIESISTQGPSDVIKTHHNRVAPVLKLIRDGRVIEPFRELFKDEVRSVAKELGLPDAIIHRHPFPGPGLAVRILGEVTPRRLNVLRQADWIVEEEIRQSGLYKKLWQGFPVLIPVRSVGVMGDKRAYGHTVALRIVTSQDGMTADFAYLPKDLLTRISNRITGEVKAISRVVLDITSKPPATIEWE